MQNRKSNLPKTQKLQFDFEGEIFAIEFTEPDSVLELALRANIDLNHSCGGNGTCGTCRIKVISPNSSRLPSRNEIEKEMAEDRGFADDERLACQLLAFDQLKVRL